MNRSSPFRSTEKTLASLPPARRYLLGVSGGRDSIALLHLLQAAGYRNLIICHFDHQLRNRASRADATFVEKIARARQCDYEIGRTNVRALARESKISIETAARIARFAFFVSVARRKHCHTIFLAHHADDLVETALFNLFRGASPAGLAAMRAVAGHRVGKTHITIVRPLLGIWRSEIDGYVEKHGLKFREDASNTELSSTRNRIRHRILPYIEKRLGRDVRRAIWRVAQIWSEEETFLQSMIDDGKFTAAKIELAKLQSLPIALQRRAIVRWLRAQEIAEVGFELVEKIREVIEPGARTAKVNLPGGRYLRRRAGKIFLQ